MASSAPISARTKLTPTAPTYGSAGASGVSTTANASRPHGIPPSGQPLRTTSAVVHAAANQSGQSRCRWTTADTRPAQRVEQRLEQGQRDPGGHAHRAHPEDVGEVERAPEHQADEERPALALVAGQQRERGDRERDHARERHRLERQAQGQARDGSQGDADGHGSTLLADPWGRPIDLQRSEGSRITSVRPENRLDDEVGLLSRGCGPLRPHSHGTLPESPWTGLAGDGFSPSGGLVDQCVSHDLHERTADTVTLRTGPCQPPADLRKREKPQVRGHAPFTDGSRHFSVRAACRPHPSHQDQTRARDPVRSHVLVADVGVGDVDRAGAPAGPR